MGAEMYGENLIDVLLSQFSFSELLELNDLTEEEVLRYLIDGGMIGEPQRLISEFEDSSAETAD